MLERIGGPARGRVIALLAGVLALQSADLASIGAVGTQLESSLGIGSVELGLLASIASLLAAAAALPFGVLADRFARVPVLALTVATWGVAMVGAGLAGSFALLLATRVFLGVAIAAAGPLLASLMGDLFPAAERARIYGYVLSGELIGSGFGFLVSGNLAGLLSWRWAFWAMAAPAIGLAWALARLLPEPARGGQSHLRPGDREVLSAERARRLRPRRPGANGDGDGEERLAHRIARREHVEPSRSAIVGGDVARMSLPEAVRYVVRVRTNLILIAVSATGYFFLGGVQTFGVMFLRRGYGLGQAAATSAFAVLGLGALAGVLIGGRVADRLLRRGRVDGRILVGIVAFLGAAAIALPPFAGSWPLLAAMPLFVLATAVLSCANPPLDAARLDVIVAGIWGRAEAIRTALRSLAIAAAPLLFGAIAAAIDGGRGEGLRLTFTVMLLPLALAGLILLRARRTYPRDVAAAEASAQRTRGGGRR